MGFKYSLSFAVKDEKEHKEIKTKFDRYNMNGSNKEHFLEMVDYFNFHRKDIEDKIRLEKSVVPCFILRLINEEGKIEATVCNEQFPKTITCGSKEYDLNVSWMYRVKDFIKKYKIVEELVCLNIDKVRNSIFITVENINEKGDVEMSERTKRYVISVSYKSEEDRNIDRDKLRSFIMEPDEQQSDVLGRVLSFADVFGKGLVNDVDRTNKLNDFIVNNLTLDSNGEFGINLHSQLKKHRESIKVTKHDCKDIDAECCKLSDLINEMDRITTNTYNYIDYSTENIVEDILNEPWCDIDLVVSGWSRGKSNGVYTTHGVESSENLINIIGDAHSKLHDHGINFPEIRISIESGLKRFVLNNPIEAIRYHLGISNKLVINVIINREEKECRGILGRLFNRKPEEIWIYENDVTIVVSSELN